MPFSNLSSFHAPKYVFFVYVAFCLYIGVCLLVIPWVPWVWENNFFLIRYRFLRLVLLNPFFRGAVSGLGAVNVIVGIFVVVRFFRERGGRPDSS